MQRTRDPAPWASPVSSIETQRPYLNIAELEHLFQFLKNDKDPESGKPKLPRSL